jgi:hypothetical protein
MINAIGTALRTRYAEMVLAFVIGSFANRDLGVPKRASPLSQFIRLDELSSRCRFPAVNLSNCSDHSSFRTGNLRNVRRHNKPPLATAARRPRLRSSPVVPKLVDAAISDTYL